jgi:urease accessory protein
MQGVGDFYAGVLHPITAIEFALPMIALSLLAGQQDRETAIAILATFPAMLAVGATVGVLVHVPPHLGFINTASMAILGLLVAWAATLPKAISLGLAVCLGLTIVWPNGAELTADTSVYRFAPGLALAGLLLIAYGAGLVRSLKAPWMRIGVRVVGSWIATAGILALGLK